MALFTANHAEMTRTTMAVILIVIVSLLLMAIIAYQLKRALP